MSARSSTPMAFPIAGPRDLLEKAKREIDRLEETAAGFWGEPDPVAVADLTINAAWSVWHATDWIGFRHLNVVKSIVPRQMKRPARKRTEAFQRRLRVLVPELRITWGLALRFKHLELDTDEARDMFDEDAVLSVPAAYGHGPVVISADVGDQISVPSFSMTTKPLDLDEVQFSATAMGSIAGPSKTTMHPKVTYRKQRLRLTEVYGRAYKFLDELLTKHGL